MDRAVLDAYGWADLKPTCEFLLDYEEDEDEEEGGGRRRKKPWRYRWPDEFRDEVLARLLELNRQRAEEERLSGAAAEKKPRTPKRPGRKRAGSIRSGRDVAARTYTPSSPSAPSICVSIWLTTRSVTPVLSCPRFGAMLSNSSKNSTQGFAACARSNRSRLKSSPIKKRSAPRRGRTSKAPR